MRVVMLSCNTGEGHNSTARAIQEVLNAGGVECEIVDVLSCFLPGVSEFVCNWHTRLYKYAPKLWDAGYRAFEKKEMRADETNMLYRLLSMGAANLRKVLDKGHYDAAVCVHIFSGLMMTELREVWNVELPCFFVTTDYTCFPYVCRCVLDGVFIPSAALTGEFIDAGLPKEKLIPSGIPVRQAFYRRVDKAAAREALGLPREGLVILLMCGSMGCGPMRKLTRQLHERLPSNAVVTAVCGKNEKLYESLSEFEEPGLRVLGFTDQVPLYMDAADIVVTKPGGLSSTEAANKRLPMVFINAVGGCESRNFNFFLNRGYAVGSSDPEKVLEMTLKLAADPEKRQAMSDAMERDFVCNGARLIADRVMEAGIRYRGGRIESEESGHPRNMEGGCSMDTNRRETLNNLARSFAGESQARTRYTVYAMAAREEGMEWIARVFEETAENEAVHAREFLEMLKRLGGCSDNVDLAAGYPYQLGTTLENLEFAAQGELQEHDEAYPAFAEMARREGFDEAARLWMQIARIEGVHHNTFRQLLEQLRDGTLTEKDQPIRWRCLNCGYTYESTRACDPCPVCEKGAGWQAGELDDRKMLPKKS
ncbi:MAG: ferritin family protein [Firmicutes bacterium]|nr:ferritin family protein [Bacillota bacterium]